MIQGFFCKAFALELYLMMESSSKKHSNILFPPDFPFTCKYLLDV